MKFVLALVLISFSFSSLAGVVVCEDFYARSFKGVIAFRLAGQSASEILYAEDKKNFIEVKFSKVRPEQETRGNAEYYISIPRSIGLFEGILKMRLDGDILIFNDQESYFLSCDY